MKKVLVFELNNYHTETFPIYEHVLPKLFGEEAMTFEYYVLPQKQADVATFYEKSNAICSRVIFFFIRKLQLRRLYYTWKINRIVKETGADIVVFNSVEPDRNLKVFSGIEAPLKIGVMHNPGKIAYQKGANERLFVLNKNVFDKYRERLALDGFILPFYHPRSLSTLEKKSGQTLIAVQGLVKFNRRDYGLVVDVAKALKRRGQSHIRFNIIGNIGTKDGQKLKERIRTEGLEEYFILHGFLHDREFLEEVAKCDYIMTALSPAYDQYFTDKMTASFSHSATFRIPMILSGQNAAAWGIPDEAAVVYDTIDEMVAKLLEEGYETRAERYRSYVAKMIDNNLEELKRHVH